MACPFCRKYQPKESVDSPPSTHAAILVAGTRRLIGAEGQDPVVVNRFYCDKHFLYVSLFSEFIQMRCQRTDIYMRSSIRGPKALIAGQSGG